MNFEELTHHEKEIIATLVSFGVRLTQAADELACELSTASSFPRKNGE